MSDWFRDNFAKTCKTSQMSVHLRRFNDDLVPVAHLIDYVLEVLARQKPFSARGHTSDQQPYRAAHTGCGAHSRSNATNLIS